jgi:hypothetical protein
MRRSFDMHGSAGKRYTCLVIEYFSHQGDIVVLCQGRAQGSHQQETCYNKGSELDSRPDTDAQSAKEIVTGIIHTVCFGKNWPLRRPAQQGIALLTGPGR